MIASVKLRRTGGECGLVPRAAVSREQKDSDTPMHWLAPFSVALVAVLSALQSEARAQDYPTRPVTVVAPYAAGAAPIWWRACWRRSWAIAWANHSWSRTGWARVE